MVLAVLAVVTTVAGVAAASSRRRATPHRTVRTTSSPTGGPGPWLILPSAPPPSTGEDAWVLDAFDATEIAELRRLDVEVRSDLTHHHHALVLARVPESRRGRRVRHVGWSTPDLASTRAGRLTLVLATGIRVELDGVSRATAQWLHYCHDQFGVVLAAIGPDDSAWAARLQCCGCDTPVQASRLRVA
jgi:hypothetical protein